MFEYLHGHELKGIAALQTLRGPLIDKFFLLLSYVDTSEFYFLLVPILWFFNSPKHGLYAFFLLILTSISSGTAKALFLQPRPFHLMPDLALIHVNNYGFPSGGAQLSILLAYLLIAQQRTFWSWIVGLLVVFLISLSRVYLGVHFFTDLLGGWLLGILVVWGFSRWGEIFEKQVVRRHPESSLSIALIFFLFIAWSLPTLPMERSCFLAIGASCGLFCSHYLLGPWPIATSFLGKSLQASITILFLLGVCIPSLTWLISSFPSHTRTFITLGSWIIGFSCTYGIHALFKWTFLRWGSLRHLT